MSALEKTIFEKVHSLSAEHQRTVLALVERLAADVAPTPEQLMLLPVGERARILAAQVALAADENFETFAADDLLEEDDPYGDAGAR
jgi:hypothetical protein